MPSGAARLVFIGHEGHPETIGTMGQLPEGEVLLVETVADVANGWRCAIRPAQLAYMPPRPPCRSMTPPPSPRR
jgi:4-hydroxy-3-methylbut-2-enyl diphosphate reductase IspH